MATTIADKRARLWLSGEEEQTAAEDTNERDDPEAFWLFFDEDAAELLPVEADFWWLVVADEGDLPLSDG